MIDYKRPFSLFFSPLSSHTPSHTISVKFFPYHYPSLFPWSHQTQHSDGFPLPPPKTLLDATPTTLHSHFLQCHTTPQPLRVQACIGFHTQVLFLPLHHPFGPRTPRYKSTIAAIIVRSLMKNKEKDKIDSAPTYGSCEVIGGVSNELRLGR